MSILIRIVMWMVVKSSVSFISNWKKMKIFQIVQKNYSWLGISAYQSMQSYPFNGRILLGFFLFASSFIAHFVFIFATANDFMEYVEGICTASACIIICVCFTSIVFQMTAIFKCIYDIERIILKSEL